jgi:hypothetical protein
MATVPAVTTVVGAKTTQAELAAAARAHAERATALLAEAEAELSNASPANVPARAAHRVAGAQAHAMASLALSSLVLPSIAPAGPAAPSAG